MVKHRMGLNMPIFDPTFYTPMPVILSSLEVNVAILCGSIPIFWPVIRQFGFDKIVIVNEVTVKSEPRTTRDEEDEIELTWGLDRKKTPSKPTLNGSTNSAF